MKKKITIKKSAKQSKSSKKNITIVKRGWHIEPYDEKKVYGSCVFACRMAHHSEKEAENIAEKVTAVINQKIKKRKFITSDDIYRMLIEEIRKHDEDASFLYETHRDIS